MSVTVARAGTAGTPESVEARREMVGSLEERDDLAVQVTRVSEDAHAAKRRARAMVDAIVDQAFT